MVDARLPGRWITDPRMDALSDRAWRTFTGALMWCNEAGTDGVVPQHSLRFLHPQGVDTKTLAELVDAGLFEPEGKAVRVCEWVENGQELAETVRQRRQDNRDRQRRHRATKRKPVTGDVTRDVTGESLRTGEERPGQERRGLDSEAVTDWPTAVPGQGLREAS